MYLEPEGPIISKGDTKKDKLKSLLAKIITAFMVLFMLGYWFADANQPVALQDLEDEFATLPVEMEELPNDMAEELVINDVEEELVEPVIVESADFFYKRAIEREGNNDFDGAVDDYTKAIELANKYSREMWKSLNNRGIIKAKKLKDYNGAMADFNRIIDIEMGRYDGNYNATRLESGYTNRAYVKKLKGDKDGACDDLYEALSLGVEESVEFIEKQIDKNCTY